MKYHRSRDRGDSSGRVESRRGIPEKAFAIVVYRDADRSKILPGRLPWKPALVRAEREMQAGAWAVGVYRAMAHQPGASKPVEIGYLAQTYWRDEETREIRCMIHAVELPTADARNEK